MLLYLLIVYIGIGGLIYWILRSSFHTSHIDCATVAILWPVAFVVFLIVLKEQLHKLDQINETLLEITNG